MSSLNNIVLIAIFLEKGKLFISLGVIHKQLENQKVAFE